MELILLLTLPNNVQAGLQEFPVTSPFGWRIHPVTGEYKYHCGVDLGYEYGAAIPALFPGIVIQAGDYNDGYGNQVLIYHENQNSYTRYAHCSTVFVGPGDLIDSGHIIATIGNSGVSTGPHLHLEYIVYQDGWQYADPLDLWRI